MKNIRNILLFADLILAFIVLIRSARCALKFDRDLKSRYPDTVEELKRLYPGLKVPGIAPFFSASFIEPHIVKDEKLRQLRRKAIFSFLWLLLVMVSFAVIMFIFGPD
jgi:hypothetical protein